MPGIPITERRVSTMSRSLFAIIGPKISTRYRRFLDPNYEAQIRLRREMPGTAIHSLFVASAAAIAADHIGANADLARCIAAFHDFGKLLAPQFFAGAISGDRLQAATIIDEVDLGLLLTHPWQSAKMLYLYRGFPPEVIEGVEQHHGTMKTYAHIDPDLLERIGEARLHYPGPIPTTKEAALVMIADESEAYLASLSSGGKIPQDPTRDFIRTIVHKVVMDLLYQNQFAHSGLTMPEIWKVEGIIMRFFFSYYKDLFLDHTPTIIRNT